MQVFVEISLGQQGTPERHVLKNQEIYTKKQSSLKDNSNLLSFVLVSKKRCSNLKENCLNLLSAER